MAVFPAFYYHCLPPKRHVLCSIFTAYLKLRDERISRCIYQNQGSPLPSPSRCSSCLELRLLLPTRHLKAMSAERPVTRGAWTNRAVSGCHAAVVRVFWARAALAGVTARATPTPVRVAAAHPLPKTKTARQFA